MNWYDIADPLLMTTRLLWAFSGVGMVMIRSGVPFGERAETVIRSIFFELKPFYIYVCAMHWIVYVLQGMTALPITADAIVAVYLWWRFSKIKDDDDRWKRRKKKVVEKVSQIGTRLVVVPAPA